MVFNVSYPVVTCIAWSGVSFPSCISDDLVHLLLIVLSSKKMMFIVFHSPLALCHLDSLFLCDGGHVEQALLFSCLLLGKNWPLNKINITKHFNKLLCSLNQLEKLLSMLAFF